MKFVLLLHGLFMAVASLAGQLSNVQNQRLQFDLAEQQEHRRMILATMAKINKMPVFRRHAAMRRLQGIARQLQILYNEVKATNEPKEHHRRHRFNQFHHQ